MRTTARAPAGQVSLRRRSTPSAPRRAGPRVACRAQSFGRGRSGLVARRGGVARALEQPVAGSILPARRAGEDDPVPEDRFAHQLLARVVAGIAVAIAAVHAEVVARHHDDVDALHLLQEVVDDADALRVLDQDHHQDVVVGVDGVAGAPQARRLHLARAAVAPRPGVRVVAVADRILREHHRVARLLDRVDHRDDDPEGARVGGLLDVALVGGRDAHEGNAARFGDRLDQLLRLTPGERAVLHLDPDEVDPLAGLLRDLQVRADDRVAEDLFAFLQL